MDLRQQRGLELAATRTIRRKGKLWIVPSAVGNGTYKVNISAEPESCSCPDFEERHLRCKHIFAASYVMKREENPDGSTTVSETLTVSRKTYPQNNWPAYNMAQAQEKDRFQALLFELCSGIREPQGKRNGRPPLSMADMVFSATFKVYSTLSARRFMSDLREARERGFISKVPHYNSIFNYLDSAAMNSTLLALITQSSLPLKAVETDFAADSTGFTTCRYTRWFDHKWGKERQQHEWVKAHVMCGVKTNIVTAVEIHGPNAADSLLLPPLLKATAQNFHISEVSADKGYASRVNTNAVASIGATPYIAFAKHHRGDGLGMWDVMWHYFMYNRDKFLQHYHKRSNIEATFSMIKRQFGESLRSKTAAAQVNETLCKILCHNLVVLIHEIYELGIEPEFWGEPAALQATTAV